MLLNLGEVVNILTTHETTLSGWGQVDQQENMSEWVITNLEPDEQPSGFVAMRVRRDSNGNIDLINPMSGGTFDVHENTVIPHTPPEVIPSETVHDALINGYKENLPSSRERMAIMAAEQSYAEYTARRSMREL